MDWFVEQSGGGTEQAANHPVSCLNWLVHLGCRGEGAGRPVQTHDEGFFMAWGQDKVAYVVALVAHAKVDACQEKCGLYKRGSAHETEDACTRWCLQSAVPLGKKQVLRVQGPNKGQLSSHWSQKVTLDDGVHVGYMPKHQSWQGTPCIESCSKAHPWCF